MQPGTSWAGRSGFKLAKKKFASGGSVCAGNYLPERNWAEGFLAALQALTDWLDAEQVPHTVIGAVAVSLIAQPRTTHDIDVVVWLEANRWEAFLQAGAQHGVAPRITDALGFAVRARVFLLRHETSGVSIDISCGALEFEREMIQRASIVRIGELTLKVPTPEDLIITKAVAQRPKDIADIESILSVQQNLDLERIRYWIGEFASALEMPEMQETVERLLRQHRC